MCCAARCMRGGRRLVLASVGAGGIRAFSGPWRVLGPRRGRSSGSPNDTARAFGVPYEGRSRARVLEHHIENKRPAVEERRSAASPSTVTPPSSAPLPLLLHAISARSLSTDKRSRGGCSFIWVWQRRHPNRNSPRSRRGMPLAHCVQTLSRRDSAASSCQSISWY